MTVMPFGKYKGCRIMTIPSSYLAYIADECENVRPELLRAIKLELASRYCDFEAPALKTKPVIDSSYLTDWLRRASLAAHPDLGGSVAMMKLVNELREKSQS